MNHVVYDTNIASLAVRDRMPAELGARLFGAVEVLAFVTVGELVKWSELRSWGRRQRGALDAWLGQRPVIDSTDEVSRIWGGSRPRRRRAARRSRRTTSGSRPAA